MAREESGSILGDLVEFAKSVGETLVNDPVLQAHFRLGGKELGNAFDLSRDGSISQGNHEYAMPFSLTPGEIANQKEGSVYGGNEEEDIMKEAQAAGRETQGREPPEMGREM